MADRGAKIEFPAIISVFAHQTDIARRTRAGEGKAKGVAIAKFLPFNIGSECEIVLIVDVVSADI